MDGHQTSDGGRGRKFQRVAGELRSRMTDGTYRLRSFLPSERDLAEELAVSRDTVQRALRELADEGWIASRQGSGWRVVKTQRIQSATPGATRSGRGATLGPLISEAFERPEVTLDVYTLTSESLDAHIRLQVERIRAGSIRPERIELRVLLPSESLVMPYPRNMDDRTDDRPRERLWAISRHHTQSLRNKLRELVTEELVGHVDLLIRRAPLVPAFKLYLLNGVEALHGMYEVTDRSMELDNGEVITALDVLGLGATLTHHVKDGNPDSPGSVFVDSMQTWFDSVWNRLGE
ncbi:winged helix-turn-helix domain-containing protein [Streptomyces cellostaticus]|uniref:winged helix-turn-helix domain-containing protein n=1 Tax=Streptomyces TaxID=1883 RepID=UPI0020268EEB|nr:winged helix-turn-helix domain-containing protein [Streptomyces cellostaticus]